MLLLLICLVPICLGLLIKFGYKLTNGKCLSKRKLDGKLAIVTGASAGIGVETALDLARRGARVIMACRNLEKAQKVADHIVSTTGNTAVKVMQLDTSSLASVRAFAKKVTSEERELHILVNNAGMAGPAKQQFSEDGLDLTMATNHFGPFLLTNLLGDLLKAGAPSRIVCVSSMAHEYVKKLDPDDLHYRHHEYRSMKAYSLSKLCNVLMARELATRLKDTGVTTYSLHPGVVNTEIFFKGVPWLSHVIGWLIAFMGKDAKAGAQTSIYCAVDEAVANESGLYYVDCKSKPMSKLAQHNGLVSKLWNASEIDVKLQDDEALI